MEYNGRQLLIETLQHKEVPRVPWVPFAGVHAGKITGYSAQEVLTDQEKLLQALFKANEIYRPDGQPILFDLQIEAEILGCELVWAEKAPPSVKSHPLSANKTISGKIPTKDEGRLPIILNVMKRFKEKVGNTTALYGLICGPFTLASHLRGNDLFMDFFEDPGFVKELVTYTAIVNKKIAEFYIEAGMDVIAIVDPLISQISPTHFKEFIAPAFQEIFSYLREQKVLSSLFVCGNASRNLEEMCLTAPDSISIDENIDMMEAKKITDQYNIVLGGNIPLTSLMLHGTQQDNMKYVVDLLDHIDHHNLIIAPGCDMPYDIPEENPIAIQQAIRETESVRKILENYQSGGINIELELPNYDSLKKPFIEVFTIDSDTCAACTYMVDAVKVAKKHYGDRIDYVEYKMMEKETIARIQKMGIENLPCIFINGSLKYSSIIPSRNELFEEIERSFS